MRKDKRGRMKYITIASDVSSCSKHKIVTWACYIRHNGGVIKKVGKLKEYNKNTAKCETYALINALVVAQRDIPDFKESKVIIYNEIEHVLDPIVSPAGNVRKKDEDRAEAIKTIAIPILQQAVDYERRKIKAHFKNWKTSDNPAKYAINRWCDFSSREFMRQIRKNKIEKKLAMV
jgi:hypothetical protein